MKTSLQGLLCCVLGTSLFVSREASAEPPEEHHIILIDVSGSMRSPRRTDGRTRFQEAITQARKAPGQSSAGRRYFAVWTFSGNQHTQVQGFTADDPNTHLNPTTVNTLDSLQLGTGATPLVGAACDATDAVRAFTGSGAGSVTKFLDVFADGSENNTPTSHPCYGLSSEKTAFPLQISDPGTWQQKLQAKSAQSTPLVISAHIYNNFKQITGFRAAASQQAISDSPLLEFFQGLAAQTGGTLTVVDDEAQAPVVGDTNGDFCVNDADLNFVLENYGLSVPPAPPAADLTGNGFVDYDDYMTVVNHWGEGSGCAH
jgi:hypothetical protein